MLTDIIPARYRRAVYALYAVAVVAVGSLNAGGLDTGNATDVLTYLGGALGVVAAANTRPPTTLNDDYGTAGSGPPANFHVDPHPAPVEQSFDNILDDEH